MTKSNQPYSRRALTIASRNYDISEYLVKKIGMYAIRSNLKPSNPRTATHHDPCHLVRGQGIADEPRQLLRAAFGENFVEMQEPDRCCGAGGTYGLTHRNTSLRTLQRKMEHILSTGAEIVATGCPGCMLQLMDGLYRYGSDKRVYHVIELFHRRLSNQDG